ncbi:MAG: kynurenine 3-monooxygenase [Saprospiraceae bacterium]|nr:MAG: kynurenine 3-monooxygenase [Saprospiraceae bacterium]
MAKDQKVIIVGAGLVGSLWAILMARRGYQVSVYERRGDMRSAGFIGGRSINLAMSDRGWKALEKAGVSEKIKAVAIPMYGRMMHSEQGQLTFQPYGKEGQAIYSVSRGGLNLELLRIGSQFDNLRYYFNHPCKSVDFRQKTIKFEDKIAQKKVEASADLIFGADGAFSAVRSSLQRLPRFNYAQNYLDYGYKELHIPPGPEGQHLIEKKALHIWPRGRFMLIALPNPDGSFTCTLFLPYEGHEAFEKLQTDQDIEAFFVKHFPDALALMPTLLENFHQNPTGNLVTIRCNPWHFEDQVLLIGDASHAIVPFYGQGMNSGFEDCTILDEMMDDYQEDWSKIVPDFSQQRVKDANAIADLALRNFVEMRDLVADPKFLLRKKIASHLQDLHPGKFLPVYSMVTFSHLPYNKALSASQAQDQLFEHILALDGIENNWKNNPEVERIFLQWLKEQ